jgi:hypothetical protein
MSKRLDQEREQTLAPQRMERAISELESRGFTVSRSDHAVFFQHKGHTVTFYPYSGWASGKTIKDGRGLQTLLKQLPQP